MPQSDADVLGSDGEWMIVRGDPQPHTRVPPASGKVRWPRLSLLAAAGALVIVVKMEKERRGGEKNVVERVIE